MSTDGIACAANVFVSIEHDGTTYRFKWHATNGWFAVNKDGLEISARVPPDSVWDQLTRMKPVAHKMTHERYVAAFINGACQCLSTVPDEAIAAMTVDYRKCVVDVLLKQVERYKEPRS